MEGSEQEKKPHENNIESVEECETPLMIEPPDGGWGWFIVFASFMCNVIVDGIIFSYGVLLPDLASSFGETKGKMAWVGSLLAGFYLIAGPVVSGLANTYGCRPVTIIGTVISAASFALSSFATSMEFLCVTFGLLGGIGFGFIYLPAIVTVGFYFEEKRAFATGIAVCGSGVGTFVMAPLVKYLAELYTWRGTMLILSGIILHCAVFGALFRPLEPDRRKRSKDSEKLKPLLLRIKEARDALRKWDSEDCIEGSLLKGTTGSTNLPEVVVSSDSQVTNDSGTGSDKLSDDCTNSPTGSNSSPPPPYSEVVGDEMFSFLSVPHQNNNNMPTKYFSNKNTWKPTKTLPKRHCSLKEDYLRPFYRQDILFSASVIHLQEFRSQPDLQHYHRSITKIPDHSNEDMEKRCCCSPAMQDTFKLMLDFSLLKSPTFLVLGVAGFLTLAGFFVPFMYIIDRAVTGGVPADDAPFILSVIGITNTIGRVFSGWASDRPYLNALIINNIALIIGGLVTIFCPFMESYPQLLAYGAVFGFSIACFAALRSIIVVDLLGLEKLTNAFGLLLLFQGVASIIGSPVAGMFYDMTGSYDASFYIAGTVIALSGVMGFPLPAIARWEKRRKAMEEMRSDIQVIAANSDYILDPNSNQSEAV